MLSSLHSCNERMCINTCVNKSLFQALKGSPVVFVSHPPKMKTHGNVRYIMAVYEHLAVYKLNALLTYSLHCISKSVTPPAVLLNIVVLSQKFDVSWLSKCIYMNSPKLDAILCKPCSYYLLSQNGLRSSIRPSNFYKISWGSMPPESSSLACMHTYTPDTM